MGSLGELLRVRMAPMSDFTEFSREQPSRPATMEADVFVPAAQAGFCGVAVAIPTTIAAFAWGWPWWAPLASGTATMCITWFTLLVDHRRLLRKIEHVVNRDFDGDGRIGESPAQQFSVPPATLEVTVTSEKGNVRQIQFIDLPNNITEQSMMEFCRKVDAGTPLTQGAWVGGGNPFSRAQFDALMVELEKTGMVRWKDPAAPSQGRVLTAKGRAVFAQVARVHASARNGGTRKGDLIQ